MPSAHFFFPSGIYFLLEMRRQLNELMPEPHNLSRSGKTSIASLQEQKRGEQHASVYRT
jgi:hypothetical protein